MKNNLFEGNDYINLENRLQLLKIRKKKLKKLREAYVSEYNKSFTDYDAYKYIHPRNDTVNFKGKVELNDSYVYTTEDDINKTKNELDKCIRRSSGIIRDKVSLLKVKQMKFKLLVAAGALSLFTLVAKPKLDEMEKQNKMVKAASEFIDSHFDITKNDDDNNYYIEIDRLLAENGKTDNFDYTDINFDIFKFFDSKYLVKEKSQIEARGEEATLYTPSTIREVYETAIENGYDIDTITKALRKKYPLSLDYNRVIASVDNTMKKTKKNTN